MITGISVNGFKSLANFNLEFSKGINVLIGPNGSGKTNICQAIGLLSAVAEGEISNYILSMGGAKSVFRICSIEDGKENVSREISITGRGNTCIELNKNHRCLSYKYSFSILLGDTIKLTKEIFEMNEITREKAIKPILKAETDEKDILKIKIIDESLLGPVNIKAFKKEKDIQVEFRSNPLMSCLSPLSNFIMFCYHIKNDIAESKAFNIDPNIAKKPSDITEPSELLSDGRRLANVLFSMYKREDKHGITDLNQFLNKVCSRYKEVIPEDTRDTFTRSFSIVDENGIKCSAQSLSDGTVKTIALLAGLLAQEQSTSIVEEPENYLHPWACQLLIEYLRELFSFKTCILTTHSETILNCVKPAEIVICRNIKGVTKAERLENVEQLEKTISESGFGVGFHYVSGSIGGTPE